MVQDQQQAAARRPFFVYVATGAAHAPHHVPPEWVEPNRGAFDAGWEAYREAVYEKQLAHGVIPSNTTLTPRPSWLPSWESRSADERRLFARYMEVFAGFVAHTDHHLGRLFDDLESRGVTTTAIELARALRAMAPGDRETAGLLALLLLTDTRSPARLDARGELVTLEDVDRSGWDTARIREGLDLATLALPGGGRFALEAGSSGLHSQASSWQETDCPSGCALYDRLG